MHMLGYINGSLVLSLYKKYHVFYVNLRWSYILPIIE